SSCTWLVYYSLFLFHATAPSAIYTLSLHDALPIFDALDRIVRQHDFHIESKCLVDRPSAARPPEEGIDELAAVVPIQEARRQHIDRKSTRLNSSHDQISYAVFCLKKKKKNTKQNLT